MRMLKSNFESALSIAIDAEINEGNENTAFTKGLQEILEASERGETITIEEK